MPYDYEYLLEDMMVNISSASGVSSLVSIAVYVFIALSLYTIAQRRGISKPWLAWVPVVNVWILGSLSDQYRYVVKGEVKNKRKVLLGLNIASVVLGIVMVAVMIGMIISAGIQAAGGGITTEHEVFQMIGKLFLTIGLMFIPMLAISITSFIVSAIALYDVYRSCDPENSTLYLVLSLIPGIKTITEPLFLFLCRNQDKGMPPRTDAPAYEEPVVQESYEEYTSEL